ncbi:MAG: urate hydroxylase PuuD [Vicinamibacterales bacterium]
MALSDLYSNLQLLVRWLHVLAGIIWIGHLYFFNFVNVPLQGKLSPDVKKAVNPELMPRALFWFRWGAMFTFILGLILFTQIYMYTPGLGYGPSELFRTADGLTGRAVWILLGMTLGTIMWFNVWFIIWPAQQKIVRGVRDGKPADPALPKRALMASRLNAYLSGPMLFGMLAATHYGGVNLVTALVAMVLGAAVIWHFIGISPKVGTSI